MSEDRLKDAEQAINTTFDKFREIYEENDALKSEKVSFIKTIEFYKQESDRLNSENATLRRQLAIKSNSEAGLSRILGDTRIQLDTTSSEIDRALEAVQRQPYTGGRTEILQGRPQRRPTDIAPEFLTKQRTAV